MNGIGHLTVGHDGTVYARWALVEGGTLLADMNGKQFQFTLERAPLPSEFDVRQMSTVALADLLARRLREEESEREQEALEAVYLED